ncbi:hypothetical protein [Candidatus Nitrospira allomarina]|uniref:Lipoprotein n=1 Tax=Candidatus Nitrospira allomarina TaxID=3020900 RepID=A0AA96G761_9BACT|nr:hypothetical protein [Candidatus Nitrospira allomarina]WNM56378.1 hypothetical protein PP769_10315 [Candidatus Nitrospira allomarina]
MMRQLVCLLMFMVLTGCSSYDKRTYTGLKTTAADSRFGTVIFAIPDAALPNVEKSRGCLTEFSDGELEAIFGQKDGNKNLAAAVLAAPLIVAGVSFAATYFIESINAAIDEYKKGLSGSFGAAGTANITPEKIRCIGIVRGLLGEPENIPTPTDDKLVFLYPKLGFQDYPAFYLELKVESKIKNDGGKKSGSLTLTPVYLSYADSVAKNHGSGEKHLGLALALSTTAQKKAGEIEEDKAFAVFHHDMGRLEIGKHYDQDLLKGTGASASLDDNALKNEAFNITAVVSDSEDPGIAFEVLSTTFVDRKSDLKKALEEAITNAINKTKTNP